MLLSPDATGSSPSAPSGWVVRWSHLVEARGTVLDVACGNGRHMRWFAGLGHPVQGVDRDPAAVASACAFGPVLRADIENGAWPFSGQEFGVVVVVNYLWRARLADVVASVAPGGVLLYETFAAGHESIGRPRRPEFLLQPGELLEVCSGLRVVAYEDGFEDGFEEAPARFVQRIAAVRPRPGMSMRAIRHRLAGPPGVPTGADPASQ